MWSGGAQLGLQELTSDISKLVNLQALVLTANSSVTCIPESISCLKGLVLLTIEGSPIGEVPAGLGTLHCLTSLCIERCNGLRFPWNLQVTALPMLS
jgi:hypothetical protein